MGDRPEVKTAPAPIAALDVGLLAQVLATAMARVPFRHPLRGTSSPSSNLVISTTREVIRAFMGYSSSLRIPEFRSLELVLDDVCKVIMPPFVRALDVESHHVEYGGVPGILYRPRHTPPVGVILYLHGGGYIGTSPNMYAFFTARVCRDTDCAVFVADYRLAPEFPYPAGAEDASAAYADIVARGVPAERIFLAGDSGGGGLATTLLLERPARVAPVRPAGLVLFSPEVDLRLDEPSITENADRDILPWNIPTTAYLHGVDATREDVSPLTADLSAFPPTCVTWGGDEMFRDPIRRYVERLRRAGVPTEAQEFAGMFHVFQILMPWADASRAAFRLVRSFIHTIVVEAPPMTTTASLVGPPVPAAASADGEEPDHETGPVQDHVHDHVENGEGHEQREKGGRMTTPLKKALYTAEATVHGGRDGHGRSSDGVLDLDIKPPPEVGGPGGATNPEQLFALGYAACFQSAMAVVGRRLGTDTGASEVTGLVTLGTIGEGAYGIAVELDVHIPDVDEDTARKVVEAAHEVCPYSNATRDNIEVTLTIV